MTSKTTKDSTSTRPTAGRPRMPKDYGMPASKTGLLDWSHLEARLSAARVYWVATSGPGGRPHVRPLDGLFVDGVLYVGGSPETRWARDLIANPHVAVHLDDGSDAVILEGEAELLHGVSPELARRLAAASNEKYPEYGMTEASYAGPGPFAIVPKVAFGWKNFPKDLTKFSFDD